LLALGLSSLALGLSLLALVKIGWGEMQTHEYEWYKEHTFLYPNLGYFDLIDK